MAIRRYLWLPCAPRPSRTHPPYSKRFGGICPEKSIQVPELLQVHESLRSLQTLIELQHWRRQQRDSILKDRSLTADEQSEDLQFVDDLYQQKRAELKVDTRIFEGE